MVIVDNLSDGILSANLQSLFRSVGTNHNQVVKILYRHFPERKAAASLFRLEKQTAELAEMFRDVTAKIQELEGKHITEGVISAEKNDEDVGKYSRFDTSHFFIKFVTRIKPFHFGKHRNTNT